MIFRILIWLAMAVATVRAAPVSVAALHPLMADLARQVGGDRVAVIDLVGEGANPHSWEPRPQDLKRLQESRIVLAAGKGLESYLDRLRDTLRTTVTLVEVGKTIPSLAAGSHDDDHGHGQGHGYEEGTVDPHWWLGTENMRRAARVVAEALSAADPDGRATYEANALAYGRKLEALKEWARRELARVPRPQRKLVTAHNAFAYFAREYGFEVIPLAGLTKEQSNAPQDMARLVAAIRALGVKAVFPEVGANPKTTEAIARETGARIAPPLLADGVGASGYEDLLRRNVRSIVEALAEP